MTARRGWRGGGEGGRGGCTPVTFGEATFITSGQNSVLARTRAGEPGLVRTIHAIVLLMRKWMPVSAKAWQQNRNGA